MIDPGYSEGCSVECHIVRDLFIPYLEEEVSTATKVWLEHHLSKCAACRAALEQLRSEIGATLPPGSRIKEDVPNPDAPSDVTGQHLLKRVGRRTQIIIGIVVAYMALSLTGTAWLRYNMMPLIANATWYLPVPTDEVTPDQVAQISLASRGLSPEHTVQNGDGATATWKDASGNVVQVEAYRLTNSVAAQDKFRAWNQQFSVKIAAFTREDHRSVSISRFRSGGQTMFVWQADNWVIALRVSNSVTDPEALCNQVRDTLIRGIVRLDEGQ